MPTPTMRAFILLLLCLITRVASGHAVPMDAPELARHATDVVVAEVVSAHARWNSQRTLIVTDYTLRVHDALRASGNDQSVLTVPGGTVGDETHRTCISVELQTGSTYLLFMRLGADAGLGGLVGAAQGAVRRTADGGAAAGAPSLSRLATPGSDFDALVAAARSLVRDHPWRHEPVPVDAHRLPSKAFSPIGPAVVSGAVDRPAAEPPQAPSAPVAVDPGTAFAVESVDVLPAPAAQRPKFYWERRPPAPVVFEALPRNWVWSPHDQYMMSQWNTFGDVFRVYAQDDTTWAWRNGVFELAGFPGNDQMQAQFGSPWAPGTLAICYYRWVNNGPIVEADIAVNPAYGWTLDDHYGTDHNAWNVWGFRQTILHELGHAWGLAHPWQRQNVFWDSVMNYSPKENRIPWLRADDTAAVRNAYPGIAITDGAIGMYSTDDDPVDDHPVYSQVYLRGIGQPGQVVPVNGRITIENNGTNNLVNPVVELFLTHRRGSFAGARSLGSRSIGFTLVPHQAGRFTTSITIPQGTPPGRYVLASLLRLGDGYAHNDADWSRVGETVTVQAPPQTIAPSAATQSVAGAIAPAGAMRYAISIQAGIVYGFSLCAPAGGAANFAARLELAVGGTPVATAAGQCGNGAEIAGFRATSSSEATLTVAGTQPDSAGSYLLAYRTVPDAVFGSGFE